jgi:hypothetical protein
MMNDTIEFQPTPGVGSIKPQPPRTGAAGNNSAMLGRRWSDGADAIAPVDPNAPWTMAQQWPNLVASLSEQAVESSNLMLRALNYLVGAGRLRRAEAKALSDAMHQLRATSLRAQQVTRLAGGRIRHAKERVDLAELIGHLLKERGAEFTASGVAVRGELHPVDVLLDPPVAISLLNSIVDWALSFSQEVVLKLEAPQWPGPALLVARVTTPPRQPPEPSRGAGWNARPRGRRLNDGLHWMLLRQMAQSAGLEVRRTSEPGVAVLTIEFPKTFNSADGVACLELVESGPSAGPLRNGWVLVVAKDDALRTQALDALRKMGIDAVAVPSLAEARTTLEDGKPNVLVTAYDIEAEEIAEFRQQALGGEERCPLVEITRDLPSFHLSGFDRFETPKVGREQLAAELPPTVLFELVKVQ